MLSPNDPTQSASAPHAHHAASVRLSLSEINALCFKAARGAGLGWGEAEEAGWAAAWLTRAGMPGPSIILAWLGDVATLVRPVPAPGHWVPRGRAHCPLRAGIALADFAGLSEGPGAQRLCIEAVAHPLVTLPFVARAAGRLDLGLRIGWDRGNVALDSAGLLPRTAIPDGRHHEAADLAVTAFEAPPRAGEARHGTATIRLISFDHWQALDALALRITVPPSAQSRTGAGAAGDDND